MSDLQESLVDALKPTVQRLVREEVERAKLQWRWASVKRTAELLDLSEAAVRARCERGQLPYRKLDGRLFVDLVELDRQMLQL